MEQKKYLFTGGCGRSGTSVLTTIIGAHSQIVLGMERYNKLCHKKQFSLTKEHFTKERFLKVEVGDTFYSDFSHFKLHNNIPEKWDNAKYVGVKYPRIDEIADDLNRSLGNIIIVYIYRDIFEVAESWNRRAAEAKNWPANKNYTQAVVQWNNSLARTKQLIQKGKNIICLNYEDLLFTDKPIDQLFRILDLEMDRKVETQVQSARYRANAIKNKKGNLTQMEYNFIKEHAEMHLFHEFNAIYNIWKQ